MKPRLLYPAGTIKEANEVLERFTREDEEEMILSLKLGHTNVKPIIVEIRNETEIWWIG